jgi:tRNA(fMet)-specific endonuclease VapC
MTGRELLLLDTNVVIQVCRGKDTGERIDKAYGLRSRPDRPLICVVTVGECFAFAKRGQWGEAKQAILREMLAEFVVVDINSHDIFERYAEIHTVSVQSGWNLSDNDTWIAATASVLDAVLLTTDKDFDRVDGRILKHVYISPQPPSGA